MTLREKYIPIFQKMEEIIKEKKFEYIDHLVETLEFTNQ